MFRHIGETNKGIRRSNGDIRPAQLRPHPPPII